MPSPRCQRVHDANVIRGGVLLLQGVLEIRIQFNVRVTLVADPGNRHATVSRVPKFAEFLNILECNPSEDKNSEPLPIQCQRHPSPKTIVAIVSRGSPCKLFSVPGTCVIIIIIIIMIIVILYHTESNYNHDDHHHCKGLKAFWCHCLWRK